MNEEINLRQATSEDVEDIAVLFRMTIKRNLPYLPELHSPEEDLKFFSNVVNTQDVIVAQYNDKVVGFCSYTKGWLNHLYITPGFQDLGIGTSLVNKAKADNKELNLWVFQKNTNAINFYGKNGFELKETTDGKNEEHEPDARYTWDRTTSR